MSERSPRLYLDDLLEAGRAIQSYLGETSFNEFTSDRMRQSAVIREFEIIGEAVGKLPDFGVDLAIVWEVIHNDLPVLLDQVELLRQRVAP